jgi:hypothetical protein
VAVADAYDVNEDSTLNVSAPGVLGNKDANNEDFTATLATDVSNGTLTLNPDGSFTYTPDADFSGNDFFFYRANDTSPEESGDETPVSINVLPMELGRVDVRNRDQVVAALWAPSTGRSPLVRDRTLRKGGSGYSVVTIGGGGHPRQRRRLNHPAHLEDRGLLLHRRDPPPSRSRPASPARYRGCRCRPGL